MLETETILEEQSMKRRNTVAGCRGNSLGCRSWFGARTWMPRLRVATLVLKIRACRHPLDGPIRKAMCRPGVDAQREQQSQAIRNAGNPTKYFDEATSTSLVRAPPRLFQRAACHKKEIKLQIRATPCHSNHGAQNSAASCVQGTRIRILRPVSSLLTPSPRR